jgi:RNA polymerase sigma factor (sigma-70 family)
VTQCIARYGSLVWSIARRSCASAEAEPLTRDIFAQLWQQAARHDPSSGSEPLFIAVTARRVLLDRLRTSEPRPSLQPESLGGAETITPIERCPEATLAAGVLATLDPGQRRILSLAVGQGMTYLEIGKITASSPDAAKSLVRRALVAVRKRVHIGAGAGTGADPHKRLHTLLTDRAIAGLDAKDRVEFEHLRAGAAIDPSYEAAAAAIDLALLVQLEPLPEPIKTALGEQAAQHFGFAIKKPREASSRQRKAASVGAARASEPAPGNDVDGDFGEDDFGDDELLLGEGELEATPVRRAWEQSPRSGSIDDSLESGVLESSLTDGKVDRTASPSDSLRAEIVAKLEPRSKSGPRPNRRRTDRQPSGPVQVLPPEPEAEPPEPVVTKPKAKPKPKPEPEPSESEQGSTIVRMPVRESSLARAATYVSALAALSMLVVAVWQYMHRDDPPDVDDVQAQLESAEDSLEWTFQVEQDEAVGEAAAGQVLWSPELQKGVLIVSGLAANDPSASQYQLWIRDAQREGTPVPGPVFDVEGTDEVSVAFDAVLVIGEPTAFLITVERPGGVVVSKQDRVLMVATGS